MEKIQEILGCHIFSSRSRLRTALQQRSFYHLYSQLLHRNFKYESLFNL